MEEVLEKEKKKREKEAEEVQVELCFLIVLHKAEIIRERKLRPSIDRSTSLRKQISRMFKLKTL